MEITDHFPAVRELFIFPHRFIVKDFGQANGFPATTI
jgi:hypothetical protein